MGTPAKIRPIRGPGRLEIPEKLASPGLAQKPPEEAEKTMEGPRGRHAKSGLIFGESPEP